jgi:hypothetical protein
MSSKVIEAFIRAKRLVAYMTESVEEGKDYQLAPRDPPSDIEVVKWDGNIVFCGMRCDRWMSADPGSLESLEEYR